MTLLAAACLAWLAVQAGNQEPDTGLPGDEGALRSQAFVATIPDTLDPKVNEALLVLLSGGTSPAAFAALRQALREARQAGEGSLVLLDPEKGSRIYCDVAEALSLFAA